jgi:hypothetical protein
MQRELGAAKVSVVQYLGPIYAAVIAWLVLGEAIAIPCRGAWSHSPRHLSGQSAFASKRSTGCLRPGTQRFTATQQISVWR